MAVDDNGCMTRIKLSHDNIGYVRICAKNIDETSIITVNEPIEL